MVMNLSRISCGVLLVVAAMSVARAADPAPLGKNVTVYHLGNSLTRGLTVGTGANEVDRIAPLFEATDGKYVYGTQLAAGCRLNMHWVKKTAAGPLKMNLMRSRGAPAFGDYEEAFQKHTFDAVILQPFMTHLDHEPAKADGSDMGDRQAIKRFIGYAMGDNPAKHKATERFYLYQTWPQLKGLSARTNNGTYEQFWMAPYEPDRKNVSETVPSREFFAKLITLVRQDNPKATIGLIPAGEVMCELDKKIRASQLPGIAAYLKRQGKEFDAAKGMIQLYADNIHMNPLPHNGDKCGTLGAYAAALTIYATLSGQSPVGLTAKPYEQLDEKEDAELIKAVQQTVWEVVHR